MSSAPEITTTADVVGRGWHVFYQRSWQLIESVDRINYGKGRSTKRAKLVFTFRGDVSVSVGAGDRVMALDPIAWMARVGDDEIKQLRQTAIALSRTRGTAVRSARAAQPAR